MKPEIKVSRQFLDDFNTVADHYDLRQLGEYETARDAARRDIESAQVCFAAMAERIRREN